MFGVVGLASSGRRGLDGIKREACDVGGGGFLREWRRGTS